MIYYHPPPNQEEGRLSTKRKPMRDRIKNKTEEEIEEAIEDSLEILMEIIDINLVNDKINNSLRKEENRSIECENHAMKFQHFNRMNEQLSTLSKVKSENMKRFGSEEQNHEFLLTRRKGQHLSQAQILHIARQIERFPESEKLIWKAYKLSRSTIKRIVKQIHCDKLLENKSSDRFDAQRLISDDAKQLVKSYLLPPWEPRSTPMTVKHVEEELKESYTIQRIRSFVKKEMRYAYKKGSSRPPIYATERTQLAKALFWTELLSSIGKGEIIINLDESSFDRSAKAEFSWLPVGKSCQIINDRFKGRASLILATWSTGEWLAMVVQDTINSQKFWFFLKVLDTIVSRRNEINQKSSIVIFNNARTHSSIFSKSIIKELNLEVRFWAPYWQEVAPVERIFGKIKSKLRVLGGSMNIDFSKKKGVELIFRIINSINKDSLLKAWIDVIKEVRMTVVQIVSSHTINANSY